MQELPFEIPESLHSYISQFESDPDKSIANLRAHVKKRGMDAVGFFLLAWLCHLNKQEEEAITYALKAKVCAPGSPFIEYLHYFLVHPDNFSAWKPFRSDLSKKKPQIPDARKSHTLNLDVLIDRLSKAESKKIDISEEEAKKDDKRNLNDYSQKIGDIASETLANIYEKQERYIEALDMFEKLLQVKPEKSQLYKKRITSLRSTIESRAQDNEDAS